LPEQWPAARPVMGPRPDGPFLLPNGMLVTSEWLLLSEFLVGSFSCNGLLLLSRGSPSSTSFPPASATLLPPPWAASTRARPERRNRQDSGAAASGASKRLSPNYSLEGKLPLVPVRGTAERLTGHGEVAALNPDRSAVDEGVRDLLPRGLQNSMKGGAGDAHLPRAFLLLPSLHVLQTDRLNLLDGEYHF
jgi:hypothetical protein